MRLSTSINSHNTFLPSTGKESCLPSTRTSEQAKSAREKRHLKDKLKLHTDFRVGKDANEHEDPRLRKAAIWGALLEDIKPEATTKEVEQKTDAIVALRSHHEQKLVRMKILCLGMLLRSIHSKALANIIHETLIVRGKRESARSIDTLSFRT
ncbi:hypothetical protein G9A89_013282 [Geosiphon pyriformis]|nr:hypothetical protein G9A89_013282 [Geosiphon pyriformis]